MTDGKKEASVPTEEEQEAGRADKRGHRRHKPPTNAFSSEQARKNKQRQVEAYARKTQEEGQEINVSERGRNPREPVRWRPWNAITPRKDSYYFHWGPIPDSDGNVWNFERKKPILLRVARSTMAYMPGHAIVLCPHLSTGRCCGPLRLRIDSA